MNKLVLSIFLLILFAGCNQSKNQQSQIEKPKFLIEEIDTIMGTTAEEFSAQLKTHQIVDLPFEIQSDIWLPKNDIIKSKSDSIWKLSNKNINNLETTDKFFKLINIKELDLFFYEDIELIDANWNALLLSRLQPLNDSIEVLLMSSNFTDSKIVVWFIATYDVKNNNPIDNTIVAVFQTYDDTYYESYFKIENNYSIKRIIASSYESNPEYTETHYQVNPSGKIVELLKQDYSYDNEDNLLRYKKNNNGYEVRFYDDTYDVGVPDFDLKYFKNDKIDSTHSLNKTTILFDNQERKWLTIYQYDVINAWQNDAHYKRYFYNNDVQINHIQEVKYHYENDSVLSIAFKNAKSDIELHEKQFIEFDYYLYGHSLFEPWSNSIYDLDSYNDVKTKLTYLK